MVDDRLDLRVAGEWTKRDGYTFDQSIGKHVDGRDLWSTRVTFGWKPVENLQVYAVWEHFQEDDDRVRSAKQLCKKDPGLTNVDGLDITTIPGRGLTAFRPISMPYSRRHGSAKAVCRRRSIRMMRSIRQTVR